MSRASSASPAPKGSAVGIRVNGNTTVTITGAGSAQYLLSGNIDGNTLTQFTPAELAGVTPLSWNAGPTAFINLGAVVGRDPTLAPLRLPLEQIVKPVPLVIPPFAATMDDCCAIGEWAWGAPPTGDTGLTVGVLTILSGGSELSISAVYTATPLHGDGISIDVEYLTPRRLQRPGQG